MPFLTYDPLPQCLQHSSATRFLLALDHDRGCTRYLLEVKCLIAENATEHLVLELFKRCLEELRWRENAVRIEPRLEPGIDAVEIEKGGLAVHLEHVGVVDHIQTVRLVEGGGELGEEAVGANADRT